MEIKRINNTESNLVIALFDKYRVFYKQPSDLQLAQAFIEARLNNNESVIFVALDDKDAKAIPIGFTQLYPKFSSKNAYKIWVLNDLFVEQTYRKKGIGEKLIQTAFDYAKKDGVKIVELSTAVDNDTAQKLYESIGFIKQEPSTTFFNYSINI
jgi:ribosomal protein S18 acetylase RimI-like enzyme